AARQFQAADARVHLRRYGSRNKGVLLSAHREGFLLNDAGCWEPCGSFVFKLKNPAVSPRDKRVIVGATQHENVMTLQAIAHLRPALPAILRCEHAAKFFVVQNAGNEM